MSTTTPADTKRRRETAPDTAQQQPGPAVRMRRSPVRIGLGVALIAVGGLTGAWFASQGGQSHEVLVLRAAVDAGDRIERADLTTRSVSDTSQVDGLTPAQIDSVIGRYATGNLPAGTLLVPGMADDDFAPTAGQSVIGISVKTSQRPSAGLQPGQRIRLVLGQPAQGAGSNANGSQTLPGGITIGQAWTAQVAAVGPPNDDQTITVDVTIGNDTATQIATAASTGALSIVLDPVGS